MRREEKIICWVSLRVKYTQIQWIEVLDCRQCDKCVGEPACTVLFMFKNLPHDSPTFVTTY